MKTPLTTVASPLRRQAVDTYRRAKKLPAGPLRSDLLKLAFGLMRLHKLGLRANVDVFDRTHIYRSPSSFS